VIGLLLFELEQSKNVFLCRRMLRTSSCSILQGFDNDIEVIEPTLMAVNKVSANSSLNEGARLKFNRLINSIWIENVPDLDMAVRQIAHQVRSCNLDFDDFVAPLYLVEIVIVISTEIEVKAFVVASHYEGLQEFIEHRACKMIFCAVL